MASLDTNDTVQETNDDAALSKKSASTKGYYKDSYIQYFVPGESKRSPLINRGYFARVTARDTVIKRFISCTTVAGGSKSQILSLGAGSDTAYFRLKEQGISPNLYVEVDLPTVVSRKLGVFARHQVLQRSLGADANAIDHALTTGYLKVEDYALVGADLRKPDLFDSTLLLKGGLDPQVPTLVISECVLVYLEPEASSRVIDWVAKIFADAAFFVYEQIRPEDPFGQVMMKNLERRGCPLKGLSKYKTIDDQISRFKSLGYTKVECFDMNDIYYKFLDKNVLKKAEKLEIFDEFEEWHLMQAHYCNILAIKLSDEQSVLKALSIQNDV